MILFTVSFLASLLTAIFIIRSSSQHAQFSADHDLSGPQKFHSRPVPRIGGVAIMAAVLAGTAAAQLAHAQDARMLWLLVAAGLPAFVSGLAEDLTKNMSPRRRLFFTAVSAGLAVWWLDAQLVRALELQVGRDLQFIRINGTLVGGLIGLLLHAAAVFG